MKNNDSKFNQKPVPLIELISCKPVSFTVYGLVLGKNLLLCREKFVLLQQKFNQKE